MDHGDCVCLTEPGVTVSNSILPCPICHISMPGMATVRQAVVWQQNASSPSAENPFAWGYMAYLLMYFAHA